MRVGVPWLLGRDLWLWCPRRWRVRVISLGDSGLAFDGGVLDEGGSFGCG